MSTRIANGLKNAGLVLASVVVVLLLAELALWFLPVRQIPAPAELTDGARAPRYEPNQEQLWSAGWDFALVTRRHVNNYGYVNDQDYDPDDPRPLFAVVGDSYVESAMVPYAESLEGRLAAAVGEQARVYSFGFSGAPLSTYLVMAEHACEVFHPKAMAIVVVSNDYEKSLLKYDRRWPMTLFRQTPDKGLALWTVTEQTSWIKQLVSQSALARYMWFNVGLRTRLSELWDYAQYVLPNVKNRRYAASVEAAARDKMISDARRAVEAFLERLPQMACLDPADIAFVVDAERQDIYDGSDPEKSETTYVGRMRRYFIDAARDRGYGIIDMSPVFRKHYAEQGRQFDFELDSHWNELGHALVAEQIHRSEVFLRATQID